MNCNGLHSVATLPSDGDLQLSVVGLKSVSLSKLNVQIEGMG
jgi:hypothetical protein